MLFFQFNLICRKDEHLLETFTSHLFYAIHKPHSSTSNVLSIHKILYMCGKCYNSFDLNYKSSPSPITVASFQSIGSDITLNTIHSPLDLVKFHSKLILWAPSSEVKESLSVNWSRLKLNFEHQYNLFRKNYQYSTPMVLKTIPIYIAIGPLNLSHNFKATSWMPKIRILKSLDLPFVMWMTEHFEFITCSALRSDEGPENTYFSAFDDSTWVLIGHSVVWSAVVARMVILCYRNPKSKVSNFLQTCVMR